jgi:hypothetical protein
MGIEAHADVVTDGNNAALDEIRVGSVPPPIASRSLDGIFRVRKRPSRADARAASANQSGACFGWREISEVVAKWHRQTQSLA